MRLEKWGKNKASLMGLEKRAKITEKNCIR
jgi:hypothetical protein